MRVPEPVTLASLLEHNHVDARLKAGDKGQVLTELGRRANAWLPVSAADITAGLAAREELGSTGVGGGVAMPHARLPGLQAASAYFARLDRPIDFAAIDGRPVDLIFLLLSPPDGHAAHLAALSAAARRLRETSVAAAIRSAGTAEAIWSLLVG